MDNIESLNHTKWDCKYHIVFIPKGRRKVLYGQLAYMHSEMKRWADIVKITGIKPE